jgi:hypothetical protein
MPMVDILKNDVQDLAEIAASENTSVEPTEVPAEDNTSAEADTQKEKLLAGRFKTQEELEAGYNQLLQQQGNAGQQFDELRNQNADLVNRLSAIEQQGLQQQQNPNVVDYQSLRDELAAKIDSGDMSPGEGIAKIRAIDEQEREEQANAEKAALQNQYEQYFNEQMAARDEQTAVNAFLKEHPDFTEMQDQGLFEKVKAENQFVNDDYQAYLTLKAEKAFEEGKNVAANEIAGSANATEVASSPGASMKNATPAKQIFTKSEIRSSGIDAFEKALG